MRGNIDSLYGEKESPKNFRNGGVTKKTDRQANRLVKKRKNVKRKIKRLETREEEGKRTPFVKFRKKRLLKKKKRIQEKIDKNPTALKWKRDKEKKGGKKVLPHKKRRCPDGNCKEERPHLHLQKVDPNIERTKKRKRIQREGRRRLATGGFHTGAGSWIEPSSVASID